MMSRSLSGIASGLQRRAVEHVQERRAALDVAEELEPEALAVARALDETGNVGHRVAGLAGLHDAEVRMQRREGVVRDLRLRRRDRGDEAGLAGRRVADERDVRDDLEFEQHVALETGRAEQREAGRLALRGGERRVAEPALARRCDDESHAGLDHVDELFAVEGLDDRADRNRQHHLLALEAGAVVAHSRAAVLRRAVRRTVISRAASWSAGR